MSLFVRRRKRKRDRRYREEKEDERGKQQHLFSYFRRERSRRERVLFDDAQFNDVRLKFSFGDCQHRATKSSVHMLTRSAKAHNSRAQECKTDPTSQPAHDCRVGHGPGRCQAQRDPLESNQSGRAKASSCGEHERCERWHFDVTDPLPVGTAFHLLMSAIHSSSRRGGSVCACAWVKHPDIKKCTLKRPTPKATSVDVEASFGVSVGTRMEKLLTAEGLKSRLNFDVRAYFADQACGEVPDLVVPRDGQSPLLHVKAWQLSNDTPQAQCEGRLAGSHP